MDPYEEVASLTSGDGAAGQGTLYDGRWSTLTTPFSILMLNKTRKEKKKKRKKKEKKRKKKKKKEKL